MSENQQPNTESELPESQAASGPDSDSANRLYPEDQAKVDEFIKRGVNSVERKPFRPLRLLLLLIVVVMGLSLFSQVLARWAGVY